MREDLFVMQLAPTGVRRRRSAVWFLREIREIRSQHQPTIPSEWLGSQASSIEGTESFFAATDFANFADETRELRTPESAAKDHYSQLLIQEPPPAEERNNSPGRALRKTTPRSG